MSVMMRGHIVCQLCVGRSRETNKQTLDDFHRVLKSQCIFGATGLLP